MKLIRVTTVPVSLNVLLKGQLKFMKEHGFEVVAVSSDGPEVKEICEREGVAHEAVEMTRCISPLADLIALYKLIRLFKKHKPDIVHSHTPKAGLLAMLAAFICQVPVRLHTVPGVRFMEITGLTQQILMFTEWLTYKCATRVYFNSFNLQQFILDTIAVPKSKVEVIGNGSTNGIDSRFFSRDVKFDDCMREKYGIAPGDMVFLFIGRIVRDKGVIELVNSFVKINEDFPDTHLLLVGPFEPELDPVPENVMKIIDEHPKITCTGFQKEVRTFFRAGDIFVFPSYREGFPNVVMQAGCMELPSIVSDINGCNEIISNDINGLIVPPKDEASVYEKMKLLILNNALRLKLAANARRAVTSRYEQILVWVAVFNEYINQLQLLGLPVEMTALPEPVQPEPVSQQPVAREHYMRQELMRPLKKDKKADLKKQKQKQEHEA